MKKRKLLIYTALGVLTIAVILTGIFSIVVLEINKHNSQVREDYAPPDVIITSPAAGTSYKTGNYVEVTAIALGFQPITRVEFWTDGLLQDAIASYQPDGITPFYAHFELLVPEGVHNIVVRALNVKGVIGQSLPLNFFGDMASESENPMFAFHVDPGETLADIENKTGLNPDDILAANPALAVGVPPSGMNVVVPVPAEEKKKDVKPLAPPQNQPAPNPSGNLLNINPIPGFGFIVQNPPAAPDKLSAQLEYCWIKLQWMDNATNESGYRVYRSSPGSLPVKVVDLISSPGTGPVRYQFAVPYSGTFNVWVEAVNQGGAQPGNISTIDAATQCPDYDPERLEIEMIGMTAPDIYDKTYCYLTIEENPPTRTPLSDEKFNTKVWGKWYISSDKYVISIPKDQVLNIKGECWGWTGSQLSKMGDFNKNIASDAWDGKTTLDGGSFQIDISVSHLGLNKVDSPPANAGVQVTGNSILFPPSQSQYLQDPSLPIPYNIRQERYGSEGGNAGSFEEYEWFWVRTIKWDWKGDPKLINGFAIYLDGEFYKWIEDASVREAQIKLPATCGRNVKWQVAAVSGPAQSGLSEFVDEVLLKCNTYVKVIFDRIGVACSSDGWAPPCDKNTYRNDTMELYYTLRAGNLSKQFYGGTSFFPLRNGIYTFKDIGKMYVAAGKYPSADTFIIPINEKLDPNFDIAVTMWDQDDIPGDDLLISELRHFTTYTDDNFKVNPGPSGPCYYTFEFNSSNSDAIISVFYSYQIFSDECEGQP